MSNIDTTFSNTCKRCDSPIYQGFARCQNSACIALRDEFKDFEKVVVETKGYCFLSGAPSDVQLPNGYFIWAPYFIDYIESGLINSDLSFSKKFYDRFPHLRSKD